MKKRHLSLLVRHIIKEILEESFKMPKKEPGGLFSRKCPSCKSKIYRDTFAQVYHEERQQKVCKKCSIKLNKGKEQHGNYIPRTVGFKDKEHFEKWKANRKS